MNYLMMDMEKVESVPHLKSDKNGQMFAHIQHGNLSIQLICM